MEVELLDPNPVIRVTTDISEIHTTHLDSNRVKEKEGIGSCSSKGSRICNSNQLFQRKKFLHPIHVCNPYRSRTVYGGSYHPIPSNAQNNVSTFTQRIMSAKLLRVKQLQNQLSEAQSQLNELVNENRLLKALQKRQDNALKRYEGSQEQLPQLLKSHNEDMRVLQSKYKQVKMSYRELENKLKQRDAELNALKQQHSHLLKLSKDKQLGDRDKLTRKLQSLENIVQEQQEKIQMLNRKINLESKNSRHQLNVEMNKHKETRNQLNVALSTIQNLKFSAEGKEKGVLSLKKKTSLPSQPLSSHLTMAPPSVSIRQPTQRLIQSGTSLGLGETRTTSNSSVSFPSHISHDSSQDDGTDDTLTFDQGNGIDKELGWQSGNVAQAKSNITESSSDETFNENWMHGNEKPFSFNEIPVPAQQNVQLQKTSTIKFEPNVQSTQKVNNFIVGKLSNVGARRKMPDKLNSKNRSNHLVSPSKEYYIIDKNSKMSGKEGASPEDIRSLPSSASSSRNKYCQEDGYGNLDLHSSSLLVDVQQEMNKSPASPISLETPPVEIELNELLRKTTISDENVENSSYKTEEGGEEVCILEKEIDDLEKLSKDTISDIDRLVEEACKGMVALEGENDINVDLDSFKDLSWDELQLKVKPIKNDILDKLVMSQKIDVSTDSETFGENEKPDIVKILNKIDQQEKDTSNDRKKNISHLHDRKPTSNAKKSSTKVEVIKGDFKSCQSKFDKKKKSNIMKELFGEQPEMLGQS